MEEAPLDQYTLDTFLPEYHVAVEWDGPMHSLRKKKDRERDLYVLEKYGIITLRFSDLKDFDTILMEKLEKSLESYDKRIELWNSARRN